MTHSHVILFRTHRCFFKAKNEQDRSLDSSALWTFECEQTMFGGESINSHNSYRIQHVISGTCFFGGQEDLSALEIGYVYIPP